MSASPIEVGKKAPAFSLPNQNGKTTSLKDFESRWVVVYFYPKDDTPGCTTEACEFTNSLKQFEALNAVVFGISADSPESHQKFIAKHKLKINLLSDADQKVMEAYGAWGEKNMYGRTSMGVIRSTIIVAPDGTVARHWPKVKAEGHAEVVRKALEDLQA